MLEKLKENFPRALTCAWVVADRI
eukprot:COSAG06_NODE_42270_length_383_cov_0.908451_1_plen_23_part_01